MADTKTEEQTGEQPPDQSDEQAAEQMRGQADEQAREQTDERPPEDDPPVEPTAPPSTPPDEERADNETDRPGDRRVGRRIGRTTGRTTGRRADQPTGRRADPLPTVAAVLAVLAACWAAWSGWSWYAAAHDEERRYSQAREEVLQSGVQSVQNLSTLDHRDIAAGLRIWQDSSTGELRDQFVRDRARFEEQVRKARTITSARVLEAGVAELDDRAGRASVLAAVRITVTPPAGEPTTKQSRLIAKLTRTPAGWKVHALGPAAVGVSGD
ncbi:hypothetical protein ACFVH6_26705 [Spirillospora sp. NPDC127200]